MELQDSCDYEETRQAIRCDSSDLSIIQYNIRGINSKLFDLNQLIDSVQTTGYPDIILICESWLKKNSPKPHIQGYRLERTDRIGKKGGGVCIFLSDRCCYKRRYDLERYNCSSFESCFVEVTSWNTHIIIGSIYRPPNTDANVFNNILEKVSAETQVQGKRLVLGMDHNMDLLKEAHHAPTHQLIETMYNQGLVPMITKPTRITTFSATLIDNILVDKQLQSIADSGILLENLSDHLPCYCILRNLNPHRKEDLEITSRDTRPKNIKALKRTLQDATVLEVDPTGTAEEQFNEFHEKLESTINHFLPIQTRKIPARKMRREPWLTPGLEISIKKCKSLYKNHMKDRTNDKKYSRYLTYNQQLKRTKRHAKKKILHRKMFRKQKELSTALENNQQRH